MQLATVIGKCTASVKHVSLNGWPLLIVQPLAADLSDDGLPMIAVDPLGCGRGDNVILSSDGKATRELLNNLNTPARWMIMGLADV